MLSQLTGGDAGKSIKQRLEEHVEVALEHLLANSLAHGGQLKQTRRRQQRAAQRRW